MDTKELRKLRRDYKRLHAAHMKIMDLYARAPGWANPKPTTKLVYGMYQTAKKAVMSVETVAR
jgi:hypothetical protein